ncbi:MAG: ParB/RepB/Spo0J family partition protein [Candidatus Omnitrophica bacterium]|nr:ParB/RepB/Spo0J family partition protein [Candidatus Omnitrophota bacterium]
MARYAFRVLSVSKISKRMPWNYRYRLEDAFLKVSVQRAGVLTPLIVTGGARPALIAGHRRFIAARANGSREVPVFLAGSIEPRDAFILNLVSNWRQSCSVMDRVLAIALAERLGFSEEELREFVMPLLGLTGDLAVLELYRKARLFPRSLSDLFEDGAIPFRGALPLSRLSLADQAYFADEAVRGVKFTSSQVLQAAEWLVDVVKVTGKDLGSIFREHRLMEGLERPGMDLRTKADKLFGRIKWIRFPAYEDHLKTFEDRSGLIVRGAKNLSIRPADGFEERGFDIQARVRTPEDLDLLLDKLLKERSALNSLFEFML